MTLKKLDRNCIAGTYKRFDLEIVSGSGALCYDENGKEYIDMTSGIGVNAFGFSDPVWADAVSAQAQKLQHISNLYYTEPCVKLAEKLCQKTGMKKVFFSNSGAEANECAVKVARKYASQKKGDACFNIITMKKSFHGRTLTTLAATGQENFHTLFNPLTPGFVYAEPNDIENLSDLIERSNPAAVMLECIQGEGGVNPLSADFLKAVGELCAENDVILIIDEVQTGNGRTGKYFSYMNFDIHPDVVTTAKGLAGGLPMGATLMSEKVEDVLGFGDHGSTFGGNPVCAAAALTVVDRLTGDFMAEVRAKGDFLKDAFEAAGFEVSGLGLMLGVKTEKPVSEVISSCMEKGVLCLSAKEKLRLLPPLNIGFDALKKAAAVIIESAR